MIAKRLLALLAVCVFALGSALAQGTQELASLGDFKLESGEVIRDFKIGYRTFGELNASKSNAILFPTWFTGTTKDLVGFVGAGKVLDPAKYYVILVDAIGDGVSSSPSNGAAQSRMRFPRFTIRDMVRAEHALLTRSLTVPHLRAVMGISMGGMQTFEWVVSYTDFMDKAIPIVGTPQMTSYDLLLWTAELHAIEGAEDWKGGEYTSPPVGAMKTVADIHSLALTTPQYRVTHTNSGDFSKFLESTEQSTMEKFDANNWVRQLQAMMGHDISSSAPGRGGSMEKAAELVRAQLLVIAATQDHMVNPQPALAFARLVHAQTLVLDSDCGHISNGCEQAKVARAIQQFLAN